MRLDPTAGGDTSRFRLCAFDVLALDGEYLRKLPLSMRKANLERLLRGGLMGSSSTLSRAVQLGLISSARPAAWG
jgi:ATP-dependent DNA ligase